MKLIDFIDRRPVFMALDEGAGSATTSQTGAEIVAAIKVAYESNADTNAFSDAARTKLEGIEPGATGDQTGAEIVAAIDAELGTPWRQGGTGGTGGTGATGAEIVALVDAALGVGEEWRQGAVAISVALDVAAAQIELHSTFDGTLYHLQDATDRDRAEIEAKGTPLAVTAGRTAQGVALSGSPGRSKFQSVLKTARGAYSGVSRRALTVPATLGSPMARQTGERTAELGVATNHAGAGSGAVHAAIYPAAAAPTAAEIKAGTGATWSGHIVDPAQSPVAFSATGLAAGTAYKAHFVQDNGADSNVATSAQFTTATATGGGGNAPEVAFSFGTGTDGTNFTTPGFTLQNRPLVVFVFERNASTAQVAKTVTVGGTSVPQRAIYNRGALQISAHFIAAPGAGSVTASVTAGTAMRACHVVGIYVDGATGTGNSDDDQLTGTSVTPTVTTGGAGRKVFYAAMTASFAATLTATGATELTNEASSDEIRSVTAWAAAPVAGSQSATITNSVSGAFIGIGIEVV